MDNHHVAFNQRYNNVMRRELKNRFELSTCLNSQLVIRLPSKHKKACFVSGGSENAVGYLCKAPILFFKLQSCGYIVTRKVAHAHISHPVNKAPHSLRGRKQMAQSSLVRNPFL